MCEYERLFTESVQKKTEAQNYREDICMCDIYR